MIKHYHNQAFRNFQKSLLEEKGGAQQIELLENTKSKSGKDFVKWLETQIIASYPGTEPDINIIMGEEELVIPDHPPKYTEQQFKNPPTETVEILWEAWKKEANPGVFCSPAVWGYIMSCFIREERITPHFLMVGGNGTAKTGERVIDEALGKVDGKKNEAIDGCVRSFLRRLSGLHERGARSVYQNCPFAKAWWQWYIAEEVAKNTKADKSGIFEFIKIPAMWEVLSDKMASQLTVIGDQNIRDGLVLFLLEEQKKAQEPKNKQDMEKLVKGIGMMASWRALGFFEPEKVKSIIAEEISPKLS